MEQALIDEIRTDGLRKRFFSRVLLAGPDTCWLWTAGTNRDGHGCFGVKGRTMSAHRVSFIMHGGDPETPVVRHTCDNPRCQNPAHLLGGTHGDNVADRVARGRSAVGTRNGRSKLTADDVLLIRQMLSEGRALKAIAREYGVDPKAIRQLRDGKTWTCVADVPAAMVA